MSSGGKYPNCLGRTLKKLLPKAKGLAATARTPAPAAGWLAACLPAFSRGGHRRTAPRLAAIRSPPSSLPRAELQNAWQPRGGGGGVLELGSH